MLEAHFKEETVGLVTREEFLNKRNTLKDRLEEEKQHRKRQAEAETAAAKAERQMKKARLESKAKLSFVEDVEEEQQEDVQEEVCAEEASMCKACPFFNKGFESGSAQQAVQVKAPRPKMGKDPHVDTEFLPDRDRAKKEEDLRKQIQQEYELRQQVRFPQVGQNTSFAYSRSASSKLHTRSAQNNSGVCTKQILQGEPLAITYSFYDGNSGHRRDITVKRGDSIGEFLKQVRTQLAPEFKAIR